MIEKENFTKWRLKIFLFGIPVFFLSIGVLRFIFRVIKKYVIVFVLLLVASSNVFAAAPAPPVITNIYQYVNVPNTITITANVNPGSRSTIVYAQCKLPFDSVYVNYQQVDIGDGSTNVAVSLSCSNLDDGALYNYRLYAVNKQDPVYSSVQSITTFGHNITGYYHYAKGGFNFYFKYPLGIHRYVMPIDEVIVVKPVFNQKITNGDNFFEFQIVEDTIVGSAPCPLGGGGCVLYGYSTCHEIFNDLAVNSHFQDGQLIVVGYSSCNQYVSSTIDVKLYNNYVYSWKIVSSYSSRLWGIDTSCFICGYTPSAHYPRSTVAPLDLYYCFYAWNNPSSYGFSGGNQWFNLGEQAGCLHAEIGKFSAFQDKGANINYKQGSLKQTGRVGFGVGGFEKVIQ